MRIVLPSINLNCAPVFASVEQEELLFEELQSESFNVDHSNVIEVREWRFAVHF